MNLTISPRIGMRVVLHIGGATGRSKREHLPCHFTGVVYAYDDNGVDVQFLDHFGVAKEAHDIHLVPAGAISLELRNFCWPAPGEPEAVPPTLNQASASMGISPMIGPGRVAPEDREPPTSPAQYLSKLLGENFGIPPRDAVTTLGELPAEPTLAPKASCSLEQDLTTLLNMHSVERGSDTPDFVLSKFLLAALDAFEEAVRAREQHQGLGPIITSVTETAKTGDMEHTVTVRYDVGAAETDEQLRAKLIELGWTPPAEPGAKPTTIQLTPAEIQSGMDRVRWAENLIRQLPWNHDGRNSWLLNYGRDANEPQQPPADVPSPLSGIRWDLSKVDTKAISDELLRRGVDLGSLIERAEAWSAVFYALSESVPGWTSAAKTSTQAATNTIHALAAARDKRELTPEQANELARRAAKLRDIEIHSVSNWVCEAIIAASRGEGRT